MLFIVLELATGFCYTYNEFLGVRAIYGIAMGGLYGNAAATALEDCPERARGIISGMLQQGYAFGYLLATAFARAFVDTVGHTWRPLYWFGAGVPVLIIAFRLCLGETETFMERVSTQELLLPLDCSLLSQARSLNALHESCLLYREQSLRRRETSCTASVTCISTGDEHTYKVEYVLTLHSNVRGRPVRTWERLLLPKAK